MKFSLNDGLNYGVIILGLLLMGISLIGFILDINQQLMGIGFLAGLGFQILGNIYFLQDNIKNLKGGRRK